VHAHTQTHTYIKFINVCVVVLVRPDDPQTPPVTSVPPSPSTSAASTSGPASATKMWPDVYSLPQIPQLLHNELRGAKSIVDASSSALHKFVRVLFDDMSQYTL